MASLLVHVSRRDQRSGREVLESTHEVHAVLVDPDGVVVADTGAAGRTTFVRSSVKPFQAAACLDLLGAVADDLDDAEIAVAWASHRAEPAQLDVVARLLERSETSPADLTCPAEPGIADPCLTTRLTHNCSGKHALFALAGQHIGCPRDRLLDPDGPLQRSVLAALDDAVGPVRAIGVDGCGAPAVAVPLAGLARGFARLPSRPAERRVVAAGRAHPQLVGGAGRAETAMLAAGIVAKPGAEGVFAATLPTASGRSLGLAVKCEDGAGRAAAAAAVAVAEALGLAVDWQPPPPLGGGEPAGSVQAVPDRLDGFVDRVVAPS